jgi:hypothetical protein
LNIAVVALAVSNIASASFFEGNLSMELNPNPDAN